MLRFSGIFLAALSVALFPGCSSEPAAPETSLTELRGERISPTTPEPVSTPAPPQEGDALANGPASKNPAPAETVDATREAPIVSTPTPPAQSSPEKSNALPQPKLAPELAPAEEAGQFLPVTFDELASFHFDLPEDEETREEEPQADPPDQIPPEIRALNQKKVALKGFMLPLKVESGLVTEMLIMRDQSMCCYGTVPQINEWVSVKMSAKGVKAVMDQPVTVFGKLQVGEMRENGYLVGIYQMEGERVAGPLDL